jgi:hypothetical protein
MSSIVAKSKVAGVEDGNEVSADPVVVNTPEGPVEVEKVSEPPVVKALRFELLAGAHMEGAELRSKGEVIASDDDLVAIHGSNKFRRVE